MYICIYGVMDSGKILITFFNAVRTRNKIELTSVVLEWLQKSCTDYCFSHLGERTLKGDRLT